MDIILEKIDELMIKNNLNPRTFEMKVGLANATVQKWKNRQTAPSRRTLARISEAFDLPENYFYTEPAPKAARTQSSNLTSQEIEMLALFRQLTAIQQGKVLGYAESFLKNSQSDVG